MLFNFYKLTQKAGTAVWLRKLPVAVLITGLALVSLSSLPAPAQEEQQNPSADTQQAEESRGDPAAEPERDDGDANDYEANVLTLENEHVTVGILPQAEGRVVLLRRPGGDNVLQSAETSWKSPDESTGGIQVWNLYVPEEMTRDDVLGDYQAALGQYEVTEHTDTKITVTGPHDHPRALNITKTLELQPDGAINYHVKITNEGDIAGIWDVWNVIEHPPHAANFVPINETAPDMGVRVVDESGGGIASTTGSSFFSFLNRGNGMAEDAEARESTAYIQPRTGLSVVFNGNTAFVREFEVVPEDLIFRDRGQVEVENLLAPDPRKGHLKVSVHSPFKPLKSGESLEHRETWRLLEYDPPTDAVAAPSYPERERDQMLIYLNENDLAKPQPLRAPEPDAEFGPYGEDKESQDKASQSNENPQEQPASNAKPPE